VHRVGLAREGPEEAHHLGAESPLLLERPLEGVQLLPGREVPVPEEERRLLEARVGDQVVDVVAAVEEPPLIAVDEADLRRRHDQVLEAGLGGRRRHGPLPSCASGGFTETRTAPHPGPLWSTSPVILAHAETHPQGGRGYAGPGGGPPWSRSSFLRIFPVGPLGSAARKSTTTGTL